MNKSLSALLLALALPAYVFADNPTTVLENISDRCYCVADGPMGQIKPVCSPGKAPRVVGIFQDGSGDNLTLIYPQQVATVSLVNLPSIGNALGLGLRAPGPHDLQKSVNPDVTYANPSLSDYRFYLAVIYSRANSTDQYKEIFKPLYEGDVQSCLNQ